MEKTITKTFSIDSKLYEKFEIMCKLKNLNKSAFIQSAIKNFIVENYDIDKNSLYKLKLSSDSEYVKIINKESEFIILSNGNKINIFDFEMMYEAIDLKVYETLNILKTYQTTIDVEDFKKVCTKTNDIIEKDINDYQIENKTEIIKRIKEKRTEIFDFIKKFKNGDLEQNDIFNLEKNLSYIYKTEVSIDYKDKYYINIPKKYVDINFQNFLNGFDYEIVDIKEKTILEKINEVLKNFINQDYSHVQDKCNHIANNLKMIIKQAIYGKYSSFILDDSIKIDVNYDTPLYTIIIDKEFICQELINFISKSYGIKDYIINQR